MHKASNYMGMKWILVATKGGIILVWKWSWPPKDYSSLVCSYCLLPDIHYIWCFLQITLTPNKMVYFVSIEWATNLPLFQTPSGMCCSCVKHNNYYCKRVVSYLSKFCFLNYITKLDMCFFVSTKGLSFLILYLFMLL